MASNRRQFLQQSLSSLVGLSLKASLIGVPASFLVNRSTYAAAPGGVKYTIFSGSSAGETLNCNGPGSYSNTPGDPASYIEHTGIWSDPVEVKLGSQTTLAAPPYAELNQEFLDELTCFNYRSHTNAHSELPNVMQLQGALRNSLGEGREELPAAIAQETRDTLGTTLQTPFVIFGDEYSNEGSPLVRMEPTTFKSIVFDNATETILGIDLDQFDLAHSFFIDQLYKDLKVNGTPKQKQYLDNYALSRSEAQTLGARFGTLLDDINDNSTESQMRLAVASCLVGFAPVTVVRLPFGQDNHEDMQVEIDETIDSVAALNFYWDLISNNGMRDKIMLTHFDVFGRTESHYNERGRDHYGQHTVGLIQASGLNAGIVGGIEGNSSDFDEIKATGINSTTGGTENPDIAADDALVAFGKTVMAAAGISEDRLDARVPDGKVIRSLFD